MVAVGLSLPYSILTFVSNICALQVPARPTGWAAVCAGHSAVDLGGRVMLVQLGRRVRGGAPFHHGGRVSDYCSTAMGRRRSERA